ncbi:MAG TPA: alpha/beta fold hydrolase, partial [Pyrinomonadaceae bacterium]|nr:alpha/beta fold hydrolase [Pyrinomonadaceae bacterium]
VEVTQVTKGNWQVEWARWTAAGDQIIFSSTEETPTERQFYSVSAESGEKMMLATGEKGMKVDPQMDDQNPQPTLIYNRSNWNRPDDLFAVKLCLRCREIYKPIQLTNTIPANFASMKWNEPAFLSIPTRDGKKVPAKVYLPNGYSARSKQKYPMVIFVHGAGYLQNIINGWNNYYREFMFNEMLTQTGYVVLDIDYRGSAGYGRDWRTDVYDFLGGKDMDDHIDAIDYVVANYAVNPAKVGVYGGSYGGFMAGMLITRAPDKVAAAAALRPVFDWKNYYAAKSGLHRPAPRLSRQKS